MQLLQQNLHTLDRLHIRDILQLALWVHLVQLLLDIEQPRLYHGDLLHLQLVVVFHDFELLLLLNELLCIIFRLVNDIQIVGHPGHLCHSLLLQSLEFLLIHFFLILQLLDDLLLFLLLLLEVVRFLDDATEALEVEWIVDACDVRNLFEVFYVEYFFLVNKSHTNLQPKLPIPYMLPPRLQLRNGPLLVHLGILGFLAHFIILLLFHVGNENIIEVWRLLVDILTFLHQLSQFLANILIELLLLGLDDTLDF